MRRAAARSGEWAQHFSDASCLINELPPCRNLVMQSESTVALEAMQPRTLANLGFFIVYKDYTLILLASSLLSAVPEYVVCHHYHIHLARLSSLSLEHFLKVSSPLSHYKSQLRTSIFEICDRTSCIRPCSHHFISSHLITSDIN